MSAVLSRSKILLLCLLLAALAGARELPAGIAWTLDLPAERNSDLFPVGNERVILRAGDALLCVALGDGSILWRRPIEGRDYARFLPLPDALALLHEDSVYGHPGVIAFETATGAPRWRHSGRYPASDAGRLWVLLEDAVAELDPRTGAELRRVAVPGVESFAPEGDRVWFVTSKQVGLATASGVLWQLEREQPRLLGPGLVQEAYRDVSWLAGDGSVLARRPVTPAYYRDGVLVGASQGVRAWDRQGKLLWSLSGRSSQGYDFPKPGLVQLDTGLYELRTGKRLSAGHPGEGLWLGGRLYREEGPDLLIGQKRLRNLFTGWSSGLDGRLIGGRVVLLKGGTLLALGEGPGVARSAGQPQLQLSADPLQVPPVLRFSVSGAFLRGATCEVTQNGRVLARQNVPLRSGYEWDSADITLKAPALGPVRIVARGRGRTASAEVQMTELALLGKVSPERLYVQLQSLLSGKPIAGGQIEVKGVGQGSTDARGELSLPLPAGDHPEYVVRASYRGQAIESVTPAVSATRELVHLQTDRPLYRPGQKLFFRGVAMRLDDRGQEIAAGREVPIEIRDPADNKLLDIRLTSDAFGVVAGELTLPPEMPLGRCSLRSGADQLPFDVQEFRKPPFQVEVRSTRPAWIEGQTLTFEIGASYFFGGPVAGAEARWRLEAIDLYDEPGQEEDPLATDYRAYREFLAEGTTALDERGRAVLRLPTEKTGRDRRYLLSVTVLGGEGREVEARGATLATVGDYGVAVQPSSWVQTAGEPLTVRLRTFDRLGRPHAARGFLEGYLTDPGRRRLFRVPFQTGPDGLGSVVVRPPRGGQLELVAVSRDAAGRALRGESWVWVWGASEGGTRHPSLQLVPAKTRARVGETLRCLVIADRPGTVWLTVEGNRLYEHRVVSLSPRGSALVSLPIRPEYAPEVRVSAVMPRVNSSVSDQVTLKVPSQEHRLEVEIGKEREDFRPAQTAELTITTRHQGLPRRSSVALSLVDEALLAVRGELVGDIHRFFHETRPPMVESFELIPRKAWVAGFQTIESQAPIRENFQDTAYWNARVLTGEDGTARVSVPLPDNLTTWRASARAVSPPAEVGEASARLVVRLPIMVQSFAPRFLVHGDESDVKSLAYNRTPETLVVRTALEATGARALEPLQAESTVAPDASGTLRTRLQAQAQEEVVLLARAESGDEGDAERIRIPVKPFALPREQHFAGLVGEPRELEYRLPPEALLGKLDLRLDGSPAEVIAGTLRYLADYPYGCVEQTMSRFVPTLAAGKALRQLDLPSPVSESELQAMAAASLRALYGYQHADGGWGWWKDDATNPFLTGYVIAGLARCREAGWPVDEEVLARGVTSAREQMETAWDLERAAYLAAALAAAGHPPRERLLALYAEPELSLYSRALLARALQQAGEKPDLTVLRESARESDQGIFWDARSPTAYGWTDDDLETTCLALGALLAENPRDPLIDRGVAFVLAQRRGEAWKSTRDSALAVFFLTDFLAARSPTTTGATLEATLDGKPVALTEGRATLPLGPGTHRLRLIPGAAPVLVSVRVGYQEAPRLDVLAPESHGLTVERIYRRPGQRAPLAAPLRPQDDLEVELALTAERDLEYVMIEDPRAAGMEVPEQEVPGTSRFEIRDDRAVLFLTRLPAGRTRLVYRQRAETPGLFQALPTRAGLMYRPEVYGTSASRRLEILR